MLGKKTKFEIMKYTIELGDSSKDQLVLGILKELNVKISNLETNQVLTAKDVAFGIGREATKMELNEYLNRADNSELLDIDDLIEELDK
jgi:hypothetical protein